MAQIELFERVPVNTSIYRSVPADISKYRGSGAKDLNGSSKTTHYMASSWDTQRSGLYYYSPDNLPKITVNKQVPNITINLSTPPFVQDQVARNLMRCFRPRNDAENRLLRLLYSPTSGIACQERNKAENFLLCIHQKHLGITLF